MAILINDNYQLTAPKPFDARYMNISTPWSSIGAVNTAIPQAYRYIGLTVNINGTEHWYATGILDTDLVPKVNAGTLSGATNGIHVTAGGTQVALGGVLTGDTEFSGGKLKYNVPQSFSLGNEIVDKNYVDTVALGLQPKMAVKAATTGDTLLDGTVTSVDGISISDGDRILVKSQSDNTENGIYIANTTGWTRSVDFNESGETTQGSLVPVITGATNKNTIWVLVTADAIPDTTPMEFGLFSSSNYIAGNGIIISGSTILVDGANLAGTYINWSGTQFSVDCASIISGLVTQSAIDSYTGATQPIISAAITGVTNGLTKVGNHDACLGGTLVGNTLICGSGLYNLDIVDVDEFIVTTTGSSTVFGVDNCGFVLSFTGGTVTFDDTGGLKYGANYSANYTARSIPDVAFITGLTTGSTVYAPPLAQYSTVCVGGVDVATDLYGMTSNEILEKILVKYLTPSFSSFSSTIPSIVEVGCQLTGSNSFSWGFVNSSNICANTMYILDVTCGGTCGPLSLTSPQSITVATGTFSSCGQVRQWRGCATNTCSTSFLSSNYQTIAYYPYYWGKCTCPGGAGCNRPTATCAMVLGGSKVLAPSNGSISITFNSTDNDYLWFAIPATVGKVCWCTPSAPTNNGAIGGGVSPACNLFPAPDVVSVTSTCWSGVNYNVYISNAQTGVVIPMALT